VFLQTGFEATAHFEMQFRKEDSLIGVGVGAGAALFRAEGPLGSATGLLVPLTLEGRYGISGARGTQVYLRGGGGAALFLVDSESVGQLRKFVPCVTAGIGLARRLNAGMGLALDASYAAYLDSGDLIMGLAPGLRVFFVR